MAPLRNIDPTGLYHVMSRGNYRQPIFLDEGHYEKYLELTDRVANRWHWIVLDWCLIPNHYHLLVQLTNDGLSDGMRELNGCFSRWSNLQTGRTGTGHLVKNRPVVVDVIREGHLWELLSYIPLNPVRAGLVDEPEEWPWSGYGATVGLRHPRRFHKPNELLRMFARDRATAIGRYKAFVQESRGRDGRSEWSDQVREAPTFRRMVESPA
jgi:REP element-mobilizing transposase RayT